MLKISEYLFFFAFIYPIDEISWWNWTWKVCHFNHFDQRSHNRLLGEEILVLPGVKYFHIVDKAFCKTVKEKVFRGKRLICSLSFFCFLAPIRSDCQGHRWKNKFDVYLLIEPWISIKLCTSENWRGWRPHEYQVYLLLLVAAISNYNPSNFNNPKKGGVKGFWYPTELFRWRYHPIWRNTQEEDTGFTNYTFTLDLTWQSLTFQ